MTAETASSPEQHHPTACPGNTDGLSLISLIYPAGPCRKQYDSISVTKEAKDVKEAYPQLYCTGALRYLTP